MLVNLAATKRWEERRRGYQGETQRGGTYYCVRGIRSVKGGGAKQECSQEIGVEHRRNGERCNGSSFSKSRKKEDQLRRAIWKRATCERLI